MGAKKLTPIARRLRAEMTDVERLLWSRLRGSQLGHGFTRQFPIGNAVADFACRRAKLVVELDGRGVHRTDLAFEKDRERDRLLLAEGWRVIRITWRQLRYDSPAVLADLHALLRR